MIVVDASAFLEVLLGNPSLTERILGSGETLHCPHLLDLEVTQVLRRYLAGRELSARRASQALEDLRDMPMERYSHQPLIARIWQLRNHMTAYDAAYVALAEGLGAPLLTCDGRLARSHGHRARIDWHPPTVKKQ